MKFDKHVKAILEKGFSDMDDDFGVKEKKVITFEPYKGMMGIEPLRNEYTGVKAGMGFYFDKEGNKGSKVELMVQFNDTALINVWINGVLKKSVELNSIEELYDQKTVEWVQKAVKFVLDVINNPDKYEDVKQ